MWRHFFGNVSVQEVLGSLPASDLAKDDLDLAVALLDTACRATGRHFTDAHLELVLPLMRWNRGTDHGAPFQKAA